MEILVELLLNIILEPIATMLLEAPVGEGVDAIKKSRLLKWLRIISAVLLITALILALFAAIAGAVLLATCETKDEQTSGIVFLSVGLVTLLLTLCG